MLDTQTGVPDLAEGDKVVLHVTEGAPAAYRYSFADLHRTERRLYQLDRFTSRPRYAMTSAGGPTGRYARLLSRANRLERKLRALRAQSR